MAQIREAKKTDSEGINLLSLDLGYDIVSQEVANNRIVEILKSEIDNLWVFEEKNQIKGWIHLFIDNRVASSSFAEIGGLIVSSNNRREGIGKRLVEFAMQWAKANNLKIRVRCNAKRTDSHIFYKSVGFSSTKSQYIFEASLQKPGSRS